ncbi:MAG: TonB-dependent receptor [Roseivirga sp.]|nr:TonB-dependent receptor [Roseivirga sp.]
MSKRLTLIIVLLAFSSLLKAQDLTQTVRGIVMDETSEITLPGATVRILNTDPIIGGITNADGEFTLVNVPVGRYTVLITFVGYEPMSIPNVVVHTGKQNYLKVKLKESLMDLEEVVVSGERPKDLPLNEMAAVSARAFTVEETERYAAGLDDPARMATAFAGVTNSSLGQNAIVVRGNAPKGVLWRVEGVEVPNPSHFAGASTTGGGMVTLLSNQVLDNSDFLTGAFPAEYGNGLAGVFDMNLRTGNTEENEHSFKAGLLGIDFASEGRLFKNSKASYLFNYRYSTLGLIEPLLPEDAGVTRYQDLSFKLNFPTKRAGEFSFWGIGGKDFGKSNKDPLLDSSEWEEVDDLIDEEFGFKTAMTGFSHKINLSDKTLLKTSFVSSVKHAYWDLDKLTDLSVLMPESRVKSNTEVSSTSITLNHKFSKKITLRSGISRSEHTYDLDMREAPNQGEDLKTLVEEDGSTYRFQTFAQAKFRINNSWEANLGVHSQYFRLNRQTTLEPRASIKYNMDPYKSISFGYGNHSQMEDPKIYFIQDGNGNAVNEDLEMARAHHFVLSYDWALNDNVRFKVEPYFQSLYNVPVEAGTSFSMLNFEQDWFLNRDLENTGKGRNYGVDVTMERFFANDFYYLATGSVFESEYKGGDDIWRDTRFNRGYSFNLLGGKEWQAEGSDNKWWGVNAGLTVMGGKRITPIDMQASLAAREEVSDDLRAFEDSEPAIYNLDLTITLRKNKAKRSSVWSLQFKNLIGSQDYDGYVYNYKQQAMVKKTSSLMIPNISYKIEF